MRVLVAGANGGTGRRLLSRLVEMGHEPIALVRDPDQEPELRDLGAHGVRTGDLEDLPQGVTEGADAAVFAAGSGSRTGADKTIRVDLMGAIRLIEACRARGPERFVMLSSMRADSPDEGPEGLRHYLAAKMEADAWLRATDLAWTIVRPGRLTDDPGTGRVTAAARLDAFGVIPRDDVAAALAASLDVPSTAGVTFDLIGGDTPVQEAVAALGHRA